MMKSFLLFIFLITAFSLSAQVSADPIKDTKDIYGNSNPEFPGGIDSLHQYLRTNIVYPGVERDKGIQGTVYISFIVDEGGNVSDVKVIRPVLNGPGLSSEALRVVSAMPKWIPGRMDGKNIKVQYMLPVKFVL